MWSSEYEIDFCASCKTSDHPHQALGLCTECYNNYLSMPSDEQSKEKRRIRDRIRYIRYPEAIKAKNRAGHAKHKEARNAKRQQQRAANPEEARKKDKQRYDRDRENRCAQAKKFRAENPEKVAAWNKSWLEREKRKKRIQKLKSYRLNILPRLKFVKKISNSKAVKEIYAKKNSAKLKLAKHLYYVNNKAKILANDKIYKAGRREHYLNYYKSYYNKNRTEILAKKKIRESADPEKYKAIALKYRLTHRDKVIAKAREHYHANAKAILAKLRIKTFKKVQQSLDPYETENRILRKIDNQINKTPDDFRNIIADYARYLIEKRNKQISRGAVSAKKLPSIYVAIIIARQLTSWLSDNGYNSLYSLNTKAILPYIDSISNSYALSLKKFFSWCRLRKHLLHNPLDYIKNTERALHFGKVLSEEQQFELYDIMTSPENNPDLSLLIMLLLMHGLTHMQARHIKVSDIDFENATISIPKGQFTDERLIILDDEDLSILCNYMEYRNKLIGPLPNPNYLFVVYHSIPRNRPIGFNTLSAIIKRIDPCLTTTVIKNTWLKNFVFFEDDVLMAAKAAGYDPAYFAKKASMLGFNLQL